MDRSPTTTDAPTPTSAEAVGVGRTAPPGLVGASARIGAALGGLVLIACSVPTDTCGCSYIAPGAVVHGTATDTGGLPIQGVRVEARISDSNCTRLLTAGEVATDITGRYELFLQLSNPSDVCAVVQGFRTHAEGVDTVTVAGLRGQPDGILHEIQTPLVFPRRPSPAP